MEYLNCLCDNIIINHCCVYNTFFAHVITLRIVIGVLSFVWSFIIKCNTFIFYNVFKHLVISLIHFFFLNLGANVSHGIAKEGKMIWEENRHKFICKVEVCNASYSTKYLFAKYLCQEHGLSMESGKPRHPSTQQKRLHCQHYASMNAEVLSNHFLKLQCPHW